MMVLGTTSVRRSLLRNCWNRVIVVIIQMLNVRINFMLMPGKRMSERAELPTVAVAMLMHRPRNGPPASALVMDGPRQPHPSGGQQHAKSNEGSKERTAQLSVAIRFGARMASKKLYLHEGAYGVTGDLRSTEVMGTDL